MTRSSKRQEKKDVYVNNDSDSWSSDIHGCEKKVGSVCQRLDLTAPKDACEKKCVKHFFKVSLGKCEVTRDVNVTHCITANLKHHIEENVTCHHKPCTKHTHKKIHKVEHGDCCKVKFPECDDKITFVNENKPCDPCPGPCVKPKPCPKPCPKPKPKPCKSKSKCSDSDSSSSDSSDSMIPRKKHHKNHFW